MLAIIIILTLIEIWCFYELYWHTKEKDMKTWDYVLIVALLVLGVVSNVIIAFTLTILYYLYILIH